MPAYVFKILHSFKNKISLHKDQWSCNLIFQIHFRYSICGQNWLLGRIIQWPISTMGPWTHFYHQYFNPDSSLSLYFKLYPRTTYQVITVILAKNTPKKLQISNVHRTVLLHVERSIFLFGFICLCSYFLINQSQGWN